MSHELVSDPVEARSSLRYWEERLHKLPVHRRRARREARERVAHWEREVVAAERATRAQSLTVARALALAGWRPNAFKRLVLRVAVAATAACTAGLAAFAAAVEAVL